MENKVTRVKLRNGMKVFLKEVHTAPIISSWIWYKVGSRDEPTGKTGISHWTEHMLFKGTDKYPAKTLDKAFSRVGGRWNAATSRDFTNYYETMPANTIDLALLIEADRMQNCIFEVKEVQSERNVIITEREGSENEPIFLLNEAVQQAAFRIHPYHHDVIGDKADLQQITRDDLYMHYQRYYVPNNAVLSIAGNFETKNMLNRIRELFEPISRQELPSRLTRPEPEQKGEIQVTVEGTGETSFLQVAYHVPNALHPDFFPLQVFDAILGGVNGLSIKTSRLYRALVDGEYAVELSAWGEATLDPFLYRITLIRHPDRTWQQALAVLDGQIQKLQEVPVNEDEISRAVKQTRAVFVYGHENITSQAFWMGYAEMVASYGWFEKYLDNLAAVTPQDVQRVAQKYFQPANRVVGIYLPEDGQA